MPSSTKDLLYRLLYAALIEIRMDGYETNNRLVYLLADLVHNIPMQLERVDQADTSPEDIMQRLRERARRNGIEEWLDVRLAEEALRDRNRMPSD